MPSNWIGIIVLIDYCLAVQQYHPQRTLLTPFSTTLSQPSKFIIQVERVRVSLQGIDLSSGGAPLPSVVKCHLPHGTSAFC